MTRDDLTTYFKFLDDLRESGITNMWGASPYLVKVFGMSKKQARDVLSDWIKTFDDDKTPAERAGEIAHG